MPISPSSTDEFKTMLDVCEEEEESHQVIEKKRRLSVNQVKELEKSFELDNKLDPDRKMNLAVELGLQTRQVAVWFQNRRARWKTKQLERDYVVLKANFDALEHKMKKLQHEKEAFLKEIEELKLKLKEDDQSETRIQELDEEVLPSTKSSFKNKNLEFMIGGGSYDSDSSAIMNGDGSPTEAISLIPPPMTQSSDKKTVHGEEEAVERKFLGEDCCSSLFCMDQAPTLHWYFSDDWN